MKKKKKQLQKSIGQANSILLALWFCYFPVNCLRNQEISHRHI